MKMTKKMVSISSGMSMVRLQGPFDASKLTVLFYLNEGCVGGQTEFEQYSVNAKAGLALNIPHKMRHQGAPIVGGVKYVLRADVIYRRPDLFAAK